MPSTRVSTGMKILCSNDQLFPLRDTDTEQIAMTISALSRAGAQVELLLPAPWGRPAATGPALAHYYETESNFSLTTVHSTFPGPRTSEKFGHALAAMFTQARRDADLLYTRNLPTTLVALAFTRTPVVYETYRPWPRQVPALMPLLRWMTRRKHLLGLITHSQLAADAYLQIGLSPNRLLVAHNGYDPRRMEPVLDQATARERLGLPLNRRIVTYAGHVTPEKGLDLMLALARRLPDTQFLIVGSSGHGELEREAQYLANVRMVPWQKFAETVPYLYAADVLFIPPTAGPLEKVGNTVLPMKVFLYLAAGRAIFAPATQDMVEVLEHGRNAVLVPPDDLELAHTALKNLLEDRPTLTALGRQATADASPMTWDRRARRILEFLETRIQELNRK